MVNRHPMVNRGCTAVTADGRLCSAPALRGEKFCNMHHPDHAAEVAEARKIGGRRRRKETTLAVAYDLEGLRTIEGSQRLLEIAALDTLALDNSVARNRVLLAVAATNAKLVETADLAARIEALEYLLGRDRPGRSPDEPDLPEPPQ
jgi:hypothetical protein